MDIDQQALKLFTAKSELEEQKLVMGARLRSRVRQTIRAGIAEGMEDWEILRQMDSDQSLERMIYQCI